MDELPDIEVVKHRPTLENLPHYDLPKGYVLRWYRHGDEAAWTAIHLVADRYNDITPALFAEQFGHDAALLNQRQCYLQDAAGRFIGTASAWFDDNHHGQAWGAHSLSRYRAGDAGQRAGKTAAFGSLPAAERPGA